jgi:vacuolar-type H+-ATPase subunit H
MSDQQARDHRTAPLMQLLDDLEAAITSGRRFPGSSKVTIDGQHVVNLIDELRVSLPVELQQARRVVQERQRIVIDAQEEARGILDSAQERANYLVSQAGVLGEARQRSEQRLREAEENAQRTRQGVSQFALSVIDDVEKSLRDQLHELERARVTLEDRQRAGV